MEYITLNNGIKMPMLGCATCKIDTNQVKVVLREAIAAGYRHIDATQGYFNKEEDYIS